MYAFAHGVASIKDTLPPIVYALLSGLNASTVGIVAVAAFQLSERTITDPLSRAIVAFTAGAGMLYNALWYFPLLMVLSGLVTIVQDVFRGRWPRRSPAPGDDAIAPEDGNIELGEIQPSSSRSDKPDAVDVDVDELPTLPPPVAGSSIHSRHTASLPPHSTAPTTPPPTPPLLPIDTQRTNASASTMGVRTALVIVDVFFMSFITLLVLRGTLHVVPVILKLATNLYLAGTIIFGGGPVVIPLLRQYIVTEGWVSSRDFLLGLAVIQAFPGPNFNFAVYLAALAAKSAGISSVVTAFLGFIAIFLPGKPIQPHSPPYSYCHFCVEGWPSPQQQLHSSLISESTKSLPLCYEDSTLVQWGSCGLQSTAFGKSDT